ncbi:hypothetical protein HFO42_22470 [Rhizobium leguminosarum]|uniref:Uncharacterized protein n=1 Tax=Rhizobium leguminosarum TaxID=384 RepID=A0AAJ1EFM3_RHILE|nr:hypothetical protein [Rhizobium leguminosarum]MBY5533735.1 hypothetical protein [Rhizobium leguminosarum]MBY5594823.1 hypothetical protein [Rhizobium leguminosarum]MBY5609351.1 hypothetical protein [Rhizobium leguminosarum]MBY5618859.1 hypothetical protein [Rhizobium leguminosarum]MBY5630848.1 hypothetical protein [Rhizobium leguminosarum]
MFVKLSDGTITRGINIDAVIQMRFDEDKHQTELFLLRENARLVFVDQSPEEIQKLMDAELERLSQITIWSIGGPNARRR